MEEVGELRGHTDRISAISVLPGEGTVFSGSHDYTVRRWDTFPRRDAIQMLREYESEVDRLEPWVLGLLTGPGELAAAISAIENAHHLTPRQRQIARQMVISKAWHRD